MAMILQNIKKLAQTQAGVEFNDCVITVPSWFDYDQKSMISQVAQDLAGLNVLQLVHENTAASVMYGIDLEMEDKETLTVMFYNMGGMDTEV